MKKLLPLLILTVILFSQCGLLNDKKKKEVAGADRIEFAKSSDATGTIEKDLSDSIRNAENERMQKTAFGNLLFGMDKNEVSQEDINPQVLGKFKYHFSCLYDNDEKLYSLILNSNNEKALKFDVQLKAKYNNLSKIITSKYGEPSEKHKYPSIFDVNEGSCFWVEKWDLDAKQIHLGIKQNKLNSYSVVCDIFNKSLKDAEVQRLKDLKNSDILEAADKF